MPVYNVEKYLRQALESVLGQTLRDIELICVDDGSTDRSMNILREYEEKDKRVRVITQNNKHAGVARNNGMKLARGEYYAFLDSDDFFEPEMLEKEYNKCKKYDAEICICGYDKYDIRTQEFVDPNIPRKRDVECFNAESEPHILGITTPAPWTKLFSAKFIRENGIEFQDLTRANDVFFTVSALALARRIVAVREVLVHYRVGMGTNLQANNDASPDDFIKAFLALKKLLVDKGIYKDSVEKSYKTMIMTHVRYNLSTLEGKPSYTQLLHLLATEYWNQFSFHKWKKTDVYSMWGYSNVMSQILSARAKLVPEYTHIGNIYGRKDVLPSVSVIIPIYNAEDYLRECLESIICQTLNDIEIICVNDGSLDSSLSIMEKYAAKDPRITVVSQKNQGQSASRNTGLSIATGEYVIFIDSDDYIHTDAMEKLYEICKKEELDILFYEADTIYETAALADSMDRLRTYYKRINNYEGIYTGQELFCKLVNNSEYRVSPPLQMIRRKHLQEKEIFFIEGIIHEDNAYTFINLLEAQRAAVCNKQYYMRRMREGSTMTGDKTFKHVYGYLRCCKAMLRYLENHPLDEETVDAACRIIMSNRRSAQNIYNELPRLEKEKFEALNAAEKIEFSALISLYELKKAKRKIKKIRTSKSYRIGRWITWIPRMVRRAHRYYNKHGLKKTLKRIMGK